VTDQKVRVGCSRASIDVVGRACCGLNILESFLVTDPPCPGVGPSARDRSRRRGADDSRLVACLSTIASLNRDSSIGRPIDSIRFVVDDACRCSFTECAFDVTSFAFARNERAFDVDRRRRATGVDGR